MVSHTDVSEESEEEPEFDEEKLKDMFRIDELDALYEEYYTSIPEEQYSEEEKVSGTIYACMQTVNVPVIYGEFAIYQNVDKDHLKEIVKTIEEDNGYDDGELYEQNTWDYVFFDLNNNNVTAQAENFAHQLVEYYKEDEDFRNLFEEYSDELSSMASMYMYRNVTPEATAPANHISWDKAPLLIGSNKEIQKEDVIEAYHNIYEKPEISPSLKYNVIDPSGVLKSAINTLDDLNLTEENRDSLMYNLYTINPEEVEYDDKTTALIILYEISSLSKEQLLETKDNISEAQFDRIRDKMNLEEILY